MSGHSKWSTIKRQKESNDAKRGAVFTKLSNAVTVAVREGGGVTDPQMNFKLRLSIDRARAANMPKENIQRAIEKGAGLTGGNIYQEVMYEGFGQVGVAILIEVTTDNKLRTQSAIRSHLERGGGAMGSGGSVNYLFDKKGYILVSGEGDRSAMILKLIDLGAEDIEEDGEGIGVYCDPHLTFELKSKIETAGMKTIEAELVMRPKVSVPVAGEPAEKLKTLLGGLEELDDVQRVFTNAEFKM